MIGQSVGWGLIEYNISIASLLYTEIKKSVSYEICVSEGERERLVNSVGQSLSNLLADYIIIYYLPIDVEVHATFTLLPPPPSDQTETVATFDKIYRLFLTNVVFCWVFILRKKEVRLTTTKKYRTKLLLPLIPTIELFNHHQKWPPLLQLLGRLCVCSCFMYESLSHGNLQNPFSFLLALDFQSFFFEKKRDVAICELMVWPSIFLIVGDGPSGKISVSNSLSASSSCRLYKFISLIKREIPLNKPRDRLWMTTTRH